MNYEPEIYEWCADNWHYYCNKNSVDGSMQIDKKSSYYILRGGSWYDFIEEKCDRLIFKKVEDMIMS